MKTQEAPLSSPKALFERLSTAQGALTLTQEAVRDATLSATLTQTLRAWLEAQLSALEAPQGSLLAPQEPMLAPQEPMLAPQGSLLAPQEPMLAPQEPMLAPQGSLLAPQEPMLAPQEPMLAPQGSLLAPQEPMLAPQEPMLAPQGSLLAPQERLALMLHLSRALCLRPLAPLLTQALKEGLFVGDNPLFERREARAPKGDGVSAFAQAVNYHASPTLALTAFELSLWLTPSAHPRRGELLAWARGALTAHPELLTPLWEAWPAAQEHLWLGEHLLALLSEAPNRGEALATRLALLRREEALPLCEALAPQLKGLTTQERERVVTPLREALHKQLMRVGQVRLWVACRALLS